MDAFRFHKLEKFKKIGENKCVRRGNNFFGSS